MLEAIGPIVLTAAVIVICLGVHTLLMRCGLGVLFDPLQATDRLVPRLRR